MKLTAWDVSQLPPYWFYRPTGELRAKNQGSQCLQKQLRYLSEAASQLV